MPTHDTTTTRPPRRAPAALAALLALATGALAARQPDNTADAPNEAQATRWVVVTTDDAVMRCGDQDIFYSIADLDRGDILASEGSSGDYTRVRYPETLSAFLPAHQGETIDASSRVRLTEPARLRAASSLRGIEGSWSPVFTQPLEPETVLDIRGIIRNDDEEIVGFRVRPPRPPNSTAHPAGYVQTDHLRDATDDEIAAHTAARQAADDPPDDATRDERASLMPRPDSQPDGERTEPKSDATRSNMAPDPDGSAAQDDAPSRPDQEGQPSAQPQTDPQTGAQTGGQSDAAPDDAGREPGTETRPTNESGAQPEPERIENRRPERPDLLDPATLDDLDRAFERARNLPRDELDRSLDELRAEYTRALSAAQDEALERALRQRLEWIDLRIETRDQRRAIDRTLARIDEQTEALADRIAAWREGQTYRLVGRLTVSSVYTGDALPLLYRVRAPDPNTGIERTIGYVAPRDGQDLRIYLGDIVGVAGEPVRDDALRVTVVHADRIQRLE